MRHLAAQIPVTQVTRLLAGIAVAFVVACGSSTAAAPAATTAAATASAATAASASSSTTAKVSANNATNEQLIAAFTAAGIPNPSSWAREVQEYRPYDTSDVNLTKLRQNLVKYNPAAGVVDKIVATLSLP